MTRPVKVVVAAFAGLVVLAFVVGLPWIPHTGFGLGEQYRVDLDVYRLGAQAFLDGTPLYGPQFPVTEIGMELPFIYPPIAAVLFAPLAGLSMPVASILMTVISGALAVGLGLAVARTMGWRIEPWWVLASVPLILLLDPVRLTLLLGQINLFLVALVLVDVLYLRHTRWSGVLIGVAAAIKLTPLVFVVWLLIDGDRRAAVRAVATFAAVTAAGFVLAPVQSVQYRTEWIFSLDPLLAPENAGNQNLRAVAVRFLGEDATPAWLAAAVGVLLLGAAVAQRCARAGEPLLGVLVLSCCALLASPISWTHHWVWCLPVLPVLYDAASRWGVAWPRWLAGTGLVLFAIGPMWLLPHADHRELGWSLWQNVVGASYVLWGLALVGLVGAQLARRAQRAQSSPSLVAA